MERFSPSTTGSVKASPICIFTSCLAIEMMASEASFGPDSATKMKQPSSICRKHFDLLLPGSGPPDCKMYRNIRNGNNACWRSGIHTPSPMAPAFFTQLLTYCLKYTMSTMQSCLIEIYQDGEHSENGNSKNISEKAISMSASSETWQLGSQTVQVSHLEKRYWPQTGFTKGDMLHYYRQIAPVVLPYFKDRPVTLRVFPQGVPGESYYLRDCPDSAPDWLRRVSYRPKTGTHLVPLPLIDNAAGLIWFANKGAIEFTLGGSLVRALTQPDQPILDLAPADRASSTAVREAALRLHDNLEQAGVRRDPKTMPGRRLHIYVPL